MSTFVGDNKILTARFADDSWIGFVFHYVFANRLPDVLENLSTSGKVNAAKIAIFKNYFSGIRTTHVDQVDHTVREPGFLQYLHD